MLHARKSSSPWTKKSLYEINKNHDGSLKPKIWMVHTQNQVDCPVTSQSVAPVSHVEEMRRSEIHSQHDKWIGIGFHQSGIPRRYLVKKASQSLPSWLTRIMIFVIKMIYSNTIDTEKKHPFAELRHEFAILVLKRTKRNADRNITADSYSIRKRHFHF